MASVILDDVCSLSYDRGVMPIAHPPKKKNVPRGKSPSSFQSLCRETQRVSSRKRNTKEAFAAPAAKDLALEHHVNRRKPSSHLGLRLCQWCIRLSPDHLL